MMQFTEKKFNIGELKGISAKTIEEHLKLYSGYVKNANLILQKVEELGQDRAKPSANADGRPTPQEAEFREKNSYTISEVQRRFGFEYNGMRNHEVYFDSLSDGAKAISQDSELYKSISYLWGSFDKWLAQFKALAMTRGVGWAMLYFDRKEKRLLNAWVDEQHLGQLQDCTLVLGLDMWEHSFVADYQPSGKKQYVEDYFENLNWKKIEENLDNAK